MGRARRRRWSLLVALVALLRPPRRAAGGGRARGPCGDPPPSPARSLAPPASEDDGRIAIAAVAVASATPNAASYYTYRLATCAGSIRRQFLPAGDARYTLLPACVRAGSHVTVGSRGNGASCTRHVAEVALQFALPQVDAPARVVAAELNVTVVDDGGGGGLAVALRGLAGLEAVGGTYPLDAADYHGGIGAPEPVPGIAPVAAEFLPPGLDPGTTVTLRSAALRDYVRGQYAAGPERPGLGGPLRRAALTLGPAEVRGCDAACDHACPLRRYVIDPGDVTLTITVADSDDPAPPTSAWVRPEGAAALRYKTSDEPATLG